MQNQEFSNKVVLVTGASRGIGRATAVAFARGGATVLINFSKASSSAEETAELCLSAGGKAELFQFDVSKSEAVDQAFETIRAKHEKIDVLVNNAGLARDGLVVRCKDEDWLETIGVNLSGSFYCARAASKMMLRARSGSIVNVSSVVGEMGNAGQVPYVSSKAGVIGMTKALAREVAPRGVTVNAVTPGFIDTEMTSNLDAKVKEHHMAAIPLARFGTSEEVADVIVFLASPAAKYITGQILGVNGGMYM